MSTLEFLTSSFVIAFAILMLRYEKPRGLVSHLVFTYVVWGAVMCVFSLISAG